MVDGAVAGTPPWLCWSASTPRTKTARTSRSYWQGEARFLFSPVVEDVVEDPEVESLLPLSGPGLLIAVRYRGFGLAICLRYNTLHYMDGLVLPWVAYYVNTHGPPF